MNISEKGLNLIKQFEGCRLKAYKDAGGQVAIGYGHTLGGYEVSLDTTCTQEQADLWLQDNIHKTEQEVERTFKGITLSQGQFDALVSLCYNIGLTKLRQSILYSRIKNKDPKASLEFYTWIRMNDHVAGGLVKRRQAEKDLFDAV